MNRRIFCLFLYTAFLTLFISTFLPHLRIPFFIPFLVFTFYHTSQIQSMWLAALSGLLFDCFSAETRFGIIAVNYVLTTFLLYRQKFRFFEDSLTTLPLMTFFYSITSTLLQVLLLTIFDQSIDISLEWAKGDLFIMPLGDALYAGIAFTLPLLFLPKTPYRQDRLIQFTR